MNQTERLLAALANGRKVTRLSAMFDLEIQSITARVSDLRDAFWDRGLEPHIDVVTTNTVDESGRSYAVYSLTTYTVSRLIEEGVLMGTPGHYRANLKTSKVEA